LYLRVASFPGAFGSGRAHKSTGRVACRRDPRLVGAGERHRWWQTGPSRAETPGLLSEPHTIAVFGEGDCSIFENGRRVHVQPLNRRMDFRVLCATPRDHVHEPKSVYGGEFASHNTRRRVSAGARCSVLVWRARLRARIVNGGRAIHYVMRALFLSTQNHAVERSRGREE
jgi:hypothetical protein